MASSSRDVSSGIIFAFGLMSVLLVLVIVLATTAWLSYEQEAMVQEQINAAGASPALQRLRAEQLTNLRGEQPLPDGRGTSISIEQAMQLVVERARQSEASGAALAPAPVEPEGQ